MCVVKNASIKNWHRFVLIVFVKRTILLYRKQFLFSFFCHNLLLYANVFCAMLRRAIQITIFQLKLEYQNCQYYLPWYNWLVSFVYSWHIDEPLCKLFLVYIRALNSNRLRLSVMLKQFGRKIESSLVEIVRRNWLVWWNGEFLVY